MTVMEAKVRVLLRIEPFLLCSAVQVFLAQNDQLDVVPADQESDLQNLPAPSEEAVQVVLREGWLKFEVRMVDRKEYCADLSTLATYLRSFAERAIAGGTV